MVKGGKSLIIVDADVLPSVFPKVLDAKKMLKIGKANTIIEACDLVGISRSAFYKYKDSVFPFKEMKGIITLCFELLDIAGILSEILNIFSKSKCNILTINQNIPVNDIANVTITFRNDEESFEVERFIKKFDKIDGIKSINVLAKE